MLPAARHPMQVPASKSGMGHDRILDRHPLVDVEQYDSLRHPAESDRLPQRLGQAHLAGSIDPAAIVSRQPGTVGGPREEKRDRIGLRNGTGVAHDRSLRTIAAKVY
jgi:hypothetical protein